MSGLVAFSVAVIASVLNTIQAGANAHLNTTGKSPLFAALVVYGVGAGVILGTMAISALMSHPVWPGRSDLASVRWWGWTGGLLGLVYVFAMLLFADKLGSAVFGAVTLSVSILTAVALDHFGLVGFKQHPLGVGRAIGCALMIAGAALIAKF